MEFLHSLDELEEAGAKLDGLKRLAEAGLPTPSILVLEHSAFLEHRKNGFSKGLLDELESAWEMLTENGGVVTVRAAFSQGGVPLLVRSQTNLPTFREMLSAVERAWGKATEFGADRSARLRVILQRFFESEKMGHLHTTFSEGRALVEVLPGQVVYAMTRGEAAPDRYVVDKGDLSVLSKRIPRKETKMVKSGVGLEEVKTSEEEATLSSLSPEELSRLVELGKRMERLHGPQEMEFAFTPEKELIFFDSRNSKISMGRDGVSISSGKAVGKTKQVESLEELPSLDRSEIAVLTRPSIDLVTFLALKQRPAGAVLIGTSPSSHSATILREAKVPAISVDSFPFPEGTEVEIDATSGSLKKLG